MKHFSSLLLSILLLADPLLAETVNNPNTQTPAETKNSTQHSDKQIQTHCLVHGDLLYWVPQVSGLDTYFGRGSVLKTTVNGISTTTTTETDSDPSSHWNVGYRIGLGVQFDQNRWETNVLWTDFQGSGYKTMDHGKWTVKLKQLDITSLHNIHLNSYVVLQPFIGLRGTSIFQKLFSQIFTDIIYPGSGTAIDTRVFQDHEQFYGVGPLLGVNGIYDLKYGLGFYGSLAFSLLYGNYHLHFDDKEDVTSPATPGIINSTVKKEMQAFDFDVDLTLGIQWKYLIKNFTYLTMKLGLENHQYFNQSRLGKSMGNVSFSGGSYSIELAF